MNSRKFIIIAIITISFGILLFSILINENENADSSNSLQGADRKEIYDSNQYGIKIKSAGLKIEENFNLQDKNTEIIDCRKMSANLRESLTKDNLNECYQVKITLADNSYIVIRTGDGYYDDLLEQSIKERGQEFKEFPVSKINLPQERITISDFPTNLIGTEVSYKSGEKYTFYKGIVYKGADKYAITVSGELDNRILSLFDKFELD